MRSFLKLLTKLKHVHIGFILFLYASATLLGFVIHHIFCYLVKKILLLIAKLMRKEVIN